jgi:hypothetical protein
MTRPRSLLRASQDVIQLGGVEAATFEESVGNRFNCWLMCRHEIVRMGSELGVIRFVWKHVFDLDQVLQDRVAMIDRRACQSLSRLTREQHDGSLATERAGVDRAGISRYPGIATDLDSDVGYR